MALTDEQRGFRAAWLYHHRVARYGRGDAALEALAEDLRQRGAYRAPDTIKGWESSEERSPIPPDVLPHLEEIFGEKAPAPKRPVTTGDLIVALNRQAAAIEELVKEIRQERENGRDVATAFDTAATALLRALRPGGSGGSTGRPVPDGKAE